jgi:hypothetical protein
VNRAHWPLILTLQVLARRRVSEKWLCRVRLASTQVQVELGTALAVLEPHGTGVGDGVGGVGAGVGLGVGGPTQ